MSKFQNFKLSLNTNFSANLNFKFCRENYAFPETDPNSQFNPNLFYPSIPNLTSYFSYFQVLAAELKKPNAPENCTVTLHTRYTVRVRCQEQNARKDYFTYVLQVYDAYTRHIIGTSTSMDPDDISYNSLSKDHDDLLLFVRTMDARSITSDAFIVYASSAVKTGLSGKSWVFGDGWLALLTFFRIEN